MILHECVYEYEKRRDKGLGSEDCMFEITVGIWIGKRIFCYGG